MSQSKSLSHCADLLLGGARCGGPERKTPASLMCLSEDPVSLDV